MFLFDMFRRRKDKELSFDEVLPALKMFVDARTPSEKLAALEREQALLLTGTADQMLFILRSKVIDNGLQGLQQAMKLDIHRELLQRVREIGIPRAWAEFEAEFFGHPQQRGNTMFEIFLDWIDTPTYRQERSFLETHRELLDPDIDGLLETEIEERAKAIQQISGRASQEAIKEVRRMRHHLEILREIWKRGSAEDAIRLVYVDRHGGLVLDGSSWIEAFEQQLQALDELDLPDRVTASTRIDLLMKVIGQAQADRNIAPEILAELQNQLGQVLGSEQYLHRAAMIEMAIEMYKAALQVYTLGCYPRQYALIQTDMGAIYGNTKTGNRSDNLEKVIACDEAALQVYTPTAFPFMWAGTQYNLGTAYAQRTIGTRKDNLEQAITCFNAALQVYTHHASPKEWAMVQFNLGNAYANRVVGEKRTNVEQAITCFNAALQIYTHDTFPNEWARTLHNLGLAFHQRITGERRENLEKSIACYNAALQIRTRDAFPNEWAMTQFNLGSGYHERVMGERLRNLEQAIACYTAALQVHTYEDFPVEWGHLQNNLGNAYRERIEGDRRNNLEKAFACFNGALQIRARDTFPEEWATTQYNLGVANNERIEGEKRDNLEKAIAHYEAALQVFTRDTFPQQWATTQDSLSAVYYERVEGERRDNLEKAIAYSSVALQVFTRDTFPQQWAIAHENLGNAYSERIEGERKANLEKAIAYDEAALQVFTYDAFPKEWATTQNNLGSAYSERIEGERRDNLENALTCYQVALQVFTRESFPMDWAKTQLGLGIAYRDRITGERRANVEQAIACFNAALRVYTRKTPVEWARTHFGLGTAYSGRIEGEEGANIEQALAHYKAASEIYTLASFPREGASLRRHLGMAYQDRIEGEERTNLEQAMTCYETALRVYTRTGFPREWAQTQHSLGNAYFARIDGKRWENLERAIACYNAALQVHTREAFPLNWAIAQQCLGNAYQERLVGDPTSNQEQGIKCYREALQVYTRENLPFEWAGVLNNLGSAYQNRIEGERLENLERAIACYEMALQVRTHNAFPLDWARTQNNLGNAYQQRLLGKRQINLEQAIACYTRALQVLTLNAFPHDHRSIQLHYALAEAERQNWTDVHNAYACACTAETLLFRMGTGIVGRDVILEKGHHAATRDGYASIRLGQVKEAAVAIESGRARSLTEALALNAADPMQITDQQRRKRYIGARERFIIAQRVLNTPFNVELSESERRQKILQYAENFHNAQEEFDTVVAEIQKAQDPPNFLESSLDTATLLRAVEDKGTGHAFVYLASTPWGGCAVAALSTNPLLNTLAHFAALDLPALTDTFVIDLLDTRLDDESRYIIGGYSHAQQGNALDTMLYFWPDKTFRQTATTLHKVCTATGKKSRLDEAAQKILSTSTLVNFVDQPLEQMTATEKISLANTLGYAFLQAELQHCLEQLSEVAIRPLIAWLQEQGVTSLTLIPCGHLAAFPLTAVSLADGHTVAETMPTSVAPSAHSLLQEKPLSSAIQRKGVYALGDPWPTHSELVWGEAEALTLAKVARNLGEPAHVKVQRNATREWLVQALQEGFIVDASCHGRFDVDEPLESALSLAGDERLRLGDVLSHEVDLRGLRLLILSACQTAILDLRGAVDEVRSLAAGMVQAGARAVLAALWSVDDRATYLLMVHFAQEWLPIMGQEPPAAALARAQCWLRTVTNRELQQWEAIGIPKPTQEERRQAGATMPENTPQGGEAQSNSVSSPVLTLKGGLRHDVDAARKLIYLAAQKNNPDACPYADPVYWAGFQITGW